MKISKDCMHNFSHSILGEGALIALRGSPMGFGTDIGTIKMVERVNVD